MSQLVHIGTCGLHTLHSCMKHGEKAYGSIVSKLLSSLYRIFDESVSRRADYEALTQAISSDYPLLFCAHCWVKNEQWEQDVWPKIVEVVDFWKGLLKVKNKKRKD